MRFLPIKGSISLSKVPPDISFIISAPQSMAFSATSLRKVSIDIVASGTRRDDLLVDERTLARVWALRNHFADMTPVEAMEFLKDRISKTHSNEEFLATIDK